MVRVFVVGMVLLLVAEALAALGFCIGFFWLGKGVIPGIMLAIFFVVLLLLPWLGDLVVEFDSLPKELKVTLSWWVRVRMVMGEGGEVRVRFLGIPVLRKPMKPKEKPAPREPEPKVDMKRWARQNLGNLLRMALAAMQAGNELVWESRALALTVNAPVGADVVDQIVAGVVGHRRARVFDVKVLPEGPRRLRGIYRISLLKVVSAGLFVLVQGRALALARSQARARKQAKAAQSSGTR